MLAVGGVPRGMNGSGRLDFVVGLAKGAGRLSM